MEETRTNRPLIDAPVFELPHDIDAKPLTGKEAEYVKALYAKLKADCLRPDGWINIDTTLDISGEQAQWLGQKLLDAAVKAGRSGIVHIMANTRRNMLDVDVSPAE